MALPGRVQDQAQSASRDIDAPLVQETDTEEIEESAVRVCMFRFGLLKSMERCHVIDRYSHLVEYAEFKKTTDLFYSTFRNKERLEEIGANIGDIDADLYNRGRDICLRTGEKWMVAGCKDCNMAMDRPIDNSQSVVITTWSGDNSMVLPVDDKNKKNKIYKLLHQITLSFKLISNSDESKRKWAIRTRDDIVKTTCLQRIVANLGLWGKTGNFRFRCVAIFYASMYIREAREEVDATTAEDWHLHCFRRFYTDKFHKDNLTFFGMELSEATAIYSADEQRFAGSWLSNIRQRIQLFMDKMDAERSKTTIDYLSVSRLHNQLSSSVVDEDTLYNWAMRHWRKPGLAVQGLLWYLSYNIRNEPSARLLSLRTAAFTKEIKSILEAAKQKSRDDFRETDKHGVYTRTRSRSKKYVRFSFEDLP